MQDFLKSRLQKLPGGVIVNASGVETHVTSGSRSVNSTTIPENFHLSALYFCGFEEAHWRNPCGMACYMFLTSDQTRFFCALRKARIERNNKKVYNKETEHVRFKQLHLNSTFHCSNRQIDAV